MATLYNTKRFSRQLHGMRITWQMMGMYLVILAGTAYADLPTHYLWSETSGNWGEEKWTDADGTIPGTFTPGTGDLDSFTINGTVSMDTNADPRVSHGQTVTISSGGKIEATGDNGAIDGQWVINGELNSIGNLNFGTANIEMNDGGRLTAHEFRVGNSGDNGSFLQNGGSVTTTGWTSIAGGGTSGSYTMKGGTLTVGNVEDNSNHFIIGQRGAGTFEMNGASAQATIYGEDLALGWTDWDGVKGTGIADIKAGTLTVARNIRVRTEGSQLRVSGGTVNVNQNIDFWDNGTVYIQTAGTVNVKNIDFEQGGTANMILSGGRINIAGSFWGQDASRTFFDWQGGTLGTCKIDDSSGYWWSENSLTFRIGAKNNENSQQTFDISTEVGVNSSIIDAEGVTAENASQLLKTGSGILTLAGDNSFKGGIRIEGGTVRVGQNTSLGTGDVILSNGRLHNNNSSPVISNNIIIEKDKDGYFQAGWNQPLTIKGNITAKGDIRINGDSGKVHFDGNTISTATDGEDTIYVDWESITIENTVTTNVGNGKTIAWLNKVVGEGSLKKTGSGILTLNNENMFTGGIRIEGGMVWVSKNSGLGSGDVVLSDGGLQNNGTDPVISNKILVETGKTGYFQAGWSKSLTIQSDITAKGNINVNSDSGVVYFDGNTISTAADGSDTISVNWNSISFKNTVTTDIGDGKTIEWNNNIIGDGALKKTGVGTLRLSGENTFSGGLSIDAGNVIVASTSSLGNGKIMVGADGTLGIWENVSTTGDLEMSGTWEEVIMSTSDYGTLSVENALFAKDSTLNLLLADDYTPEVGDCFTILTATGAITQEIPFSWSSLLADAYQEDWMLFSQGNSLILYRGNENTIPEPTTWVLLVLGLVGIMKVRRVHGNKSSQLC